MSILVRKEIASYIVDNKAIGNY